MKNLPLITTLILAFLFPLLLQAQKTETIHVAKAGTLPTLIDASDKNLITELTLTGDLNGTDIRFIREMAGATYTLSPTEGTLKELDMAGASIVAGGDSYLINPEGGPDLVTVDNQFGDLFFAMCGSLERITFPEGVTSGGLVPFLFCDNLKEIIVPVGNTFFSSENGVLYNKDKTDLVAWPTAKETEEYTLPSTVTSIEHSAFRRSKILRKLTLPAGITTIGDYAFSLCTALNEINFPVGLIRVGSNAFEHCTALEDVNLQEGLKFIESEAFQDTGIKIINFPSTIELIGEYSFSQCLLEEVVVNHAVPSATLFEHVLSRMNGGTTLVVPAGSVEAYLADNAWDVCMKYAETHESSRYMWVRPYSAGDLGYWNAGSGVFNPRDFQLTDKLIVVGDINGSDVRVIRELAGSDSSGHTTFGNVKELDLSDASLRACGTFYLDMYTLPEDNMFGEHMFSHCYRLEHVILPKTVVKGGAVIFYNCVNLHTITVPAENPVFSSFDGIFFDKDKHVLFVYPPARTAELYEVPDGVTTIEAASFAFGQNLKKLVLPASVSTIGMYAFSQNSSLEEVNIPEGVTSLGWAFLSCNKLNSVTLPETLTELGAGTFSGCASLPEIELPIGLNTIGSSAFAGCLALEKIIVRNPVPVNIDADVFDNVNKDNCQLFVPAGTVEQYEVADVWKDFLNIIDITTMRTDFKHGESLYVVGTRGSLFVGNAELSSQVSIYTIAGALVKNFIVKERVHTIDLNSGQVYIVRVNGSSFKVLL